MSEHEDKRGPAAPSNQAEKPPTVPLRLLDGSSDPSIPPVNSQFADQRYQLLRGDCLEILDHLAKTSVIGSVAMVFADPPYFLGKASWDPKIPREAAMAFYEDWLGGCRDLLEPNGTVWVSGTYHSIHLAAYAAEHLGMRLLASITWEKTNPPPSRSHRCFTHATETLLWISKSPRSHHRYNDGCMRRLNGGQPMKTHWKLPAVVHAERTSGRHPTQKPLVIVERCILAATAPGDLILDPFLGSGTTAVAALRHGRRCIGIERDAGYLRLAERRIAAEVDEQSVNPGGTSDAE